MNSGLKSAVKGQAGLVGGRRNLPERMHICRSGDTFFQKWNRKAVVIVLNSELIRRSLPGRDYLSYR
jgi:hypothetical protein